MKMRDCFRNHPIIVRFSVPNHPIEIGKHLRTRSESTDNRPIFQPQSSDRTQPQSSSFRQVQGCQSSSQAHSEAELEMAQTAQERWLEDLREKAYIKYFI